MAQRKCPLCNYLVSETDTVCPTCGTNLKEEQELQDTLLSLITHSQFREIAKEGRSNREILASLSSEDKKQAYIFADLNGGKFPWEVTSEKPEMPQMEIVYPEGHSQETSQETSVGAGNGSNKRRTSPPPPPRPTPPPKPTPPPPPRPKPKKKEKVSVLLLLLSFFMPLVGIFYFFSAKDDRPRKAKFTLVAGIIGLVSCVAITVLIEMGLVPEEIYSAVFGFILNLFK